MKLKLPLSVITTNEIQFMHSAGYHFHTDPVRGTESWSRRLSTDHYPRFHVYIHKISNHITFDLHLDQKKASYEGFHAHSGEYDGPLVEQELMRLKSMTEGALPKLARLPVPEEIEEDRPRGWLSKLFE
ncbi:MAG TPA: hypothetical protein DDW36_01815 [Candidatus Magasanikbacteria bacterium]|nr:hypothetical protein [Candidatus Magasanikbacteria bacterium]